MAKRSEKRDKKFIKYLEEGLGPTKAAPKAGYSVAGVYKWRKEDEQFSELWDAAVEIGTEVKIAEYEAECDRRAIQGVIESQHKDKNGKVLSETRRYSDTLLMFRMKRLDHRYRDKVDMNHSGSIKTPTAPVINLTLNGTES